MSDESSLFRRALFRRITQSEEVSAPPAKPPPVPEFPPSCACDEGRYQVLGPDSAIDVVDPRRRCALVVEDDDVIRDGVSEMLDDAGWVVVQGDSLDRARALLSVVRPTVLLLDYDLRGEYASVLLDEMAHARRTTPTVLLSACPLAFDAARSYKLELLPKPFAIEQLLRVIDGVLAHGKASVPLRLAP